MLFHEATVRQERNEHDLMRDFADEVSGYLNNARIRTTLDGLSLRSGAEHVGDNLRRCYESLVNLSVVGVEELPLVAAWLEDLRTTSTP